MWNLQAASINGRCTSDHQDPHQFSTSRRTSTDSFADQSDIGTSDLEVILTENEVGTNNRQLVRTIPSPSNTIHLSSDSSSDDESKGSYFQIELNFCLKIDSVLLNTQLFISNLGDLRVNARYLLRKLRTKKAANVSNNQSSVNEQEEEAPNETIYDIGKSKAEVKFGIEIREQLLGVSQTHSKCRLFGPIIVRTWCPSLIFKIDHKITGKQAKYLDFIVRYENKFELLKCSAYFEFQIVSNCPQHHPNLVQQFDHVFKHYESLSTTCFLSLDKLNDCKGVYVKDGKLDVELHLKIRSLTIKNLNND